VQDAILKALTEIKKLFEKSPVLNGSKLLSIFEQFSITAKHQSIIRSELLLRKGHKEAVALGHHPLDGTHGSYYITLHKPFPANLTTAVAVHQNNFGKPEATPTVTSAAEAANNDAEKVINGPEPKSQLESLLHKYFDSKTMTGYRVKNNKLTIWFD